MPEKRADGVRARGGARPSEADYDAAIDRAFRRVVAGGEAPGSEPLSIDDGPPPVVEGVCRYLVERSYELRFEDPRRSLVLARAAARVAESLAGRRAGEKAELEDLRAEAQSYLSNALRITSDLAGARAAQRRAEAHRRRGTGDPELEADLLRHRAALLMSLGRSREAAEVMDRLIGLGEAGAALDNMGHLLIDRGVLGIWMESFDRASEHLRRGVERVDSRRMMVLALLAMAEALARGGDGARSLAVLRVAGDVLPLLQEKGMELFFRWVRGLALRAEARLEEAEELLSGVRGELAERGQVLRAASASLDLACVYADQGRGRRLRAAAEDAYELCRSEGVASEAMAALMLLIRAARAERATAELAERAVGLLIRSGGGRERPVEENAR